MADRTEIILKALEADERIQYRTLLNSLNEGNVLSPSEQRKYDGYKAKIKQYEESLTADPNEDVVGIPERLRVKRHYNMSPEAIEQHRLAASVLTARSSALSWDFRKATIASSTFCWAVRTAFW